MAFGDKADNEIDWDNGTGPWADSWRQIWDAVTDGNCRDDVLANAPEARDGFFTVPKVVE